MKLKPYPEYKPSGVEWLGDVPKEWEVKRVRHLAMLRSGDSITSANIEPEGDYPVYGGNGLRGYTSAYTHDGTYALIGRQGALCGNINYAKGKFWASEHAVVVHPLASSAPFWMGELLRVMNLNQYSVSAAQPGLAVDSIAALQIPVPPPDEQTAIADFLDREAGKIDRLVAKKRELRAKLKEKRAALITRAVTRGLNPDAKLKPSGIEWLGDIPEHWEVKQLKWAIMFQRGHDLPTDQREEGTVPLVTSAGVSATHAVAAAKGPGIVTGRTSTRQRLPFPLSLNNKPSPTTSTVRPRNSISSRPKSKKPSPAFRNTAPPSSRRRLPERLMCAVLRGRTRTSTDGHGRMTGCRWSIPSRRRNYAWLRRGRRNEDRTREEHGQTRTGRGRARSGGGPCVSVSVRVPPGRRA